MFGKVKKNTIELKNRFYNLQWYPVSCCCTNTGNKKIKIQQMPPLMVRKAPWRQ